MFLRETNSCVRSVRILHMPRQLSCRDMCNILTWSDHWNQIEWNVTRFKSQVFKLFVKWVSSHCDLSLQPLDSPTCPHRCQRCFVAVFKSTSWSAPLSSRSCYHCHTFQYGQCYCQLCTVTLGWDKSKWVDLYILFYLWYFAQKSLVISFHLGACTWNVMIIPMIPSL